MSTTTPARQHAATLLTMAPAQLRALGAAATAGEIAQQPRLWRRVGADAAARSGATRAFLDPLLARPDLRIVLTGAGTSAFAGQILAPALAGALRLRVEAVATTDIVATPREVFAQDVPTLLVSLARSGDSPESVAATELAERCLGEVHHLVVTCNRDGQLFRDHDARQRSLVLAMPPEADDAGFAMTSSFTCMVLATWLALSPDDVDTALVERLAVAGEQALAERDHQAAALAAQGHRRLVHLGSGSLGGLAREGALKLLELTAGAVVTYFDSSLGFRHGPKAVLDQGTVVLVHVSNDAGTRAYDEDIVLELREAIGADRVIAATARPSDRLGGGPAWAVRGVEEVPDVLLSLVFAIGAQLLALHTSVAMGLGPDNPFPDGGVNRVVQGVTIHPLTGAASGAEAERGVPRR